MPYACVLFIYHFRILMQAILAFGIARVIRSKDSKYSDGDIVLSAFLPVAEYSLLPCDLLTRKLDPASGIPFPDYLSSLGNISILLNLSMAAIIILLNLNKSKCMCVYINVLIRNFKV